MKICEILQKERLYGTKSQLYGRQPSSTPSGGYKKNPFVKTSKQYKEWNRRHGKKPTSTEATTP